MGYMIPRHALNVYSQTGHAPDTPRWNMLQSRMELNPGRFSFYHPTLAPLLTDAKCVGVLPQGKFYNALRDRFGLNPNRFTRNHPLLGKLLARDAVASAHCQCNTGSNPPGTPPQVSPEILVPPTDTTVTTPTTPTDPTTPTNPTDPTNPTNPGTITPTDPTDPTNPANPVPEPAAVIQLAIGLICLGVFAILKRKKIAYLQARPA